MRICMCADICIYYIYKWGYIRIHVYVCVYTFVHIIYVGGTQYVHVCGYTFVCICVYTFDYIIYMYMCVYLYVLHTFVCIIHITEYTVYMYTCV